MQRKGAKGAMGIVSMQGTSAEPVEDRDADELPQRLENPELLSSAM